MFQYGLANKNALVKYGIDQPPAYEVQHLKSILLNLQLNGRLINVLKVGSLALYL